MSAVPGVKVASRIASVKVLDSPQPAVEPAALGPQVSDEERMLADLEDQKEQLAQAMRTFEGLVGKLQRLREKMIIEHRQAIAKLAVEIARKILARKVQEGDYQIESIVQEALNNAPARQDIVVRLNPQDLSCCEQLQQQGNGGFAGVKFVADANIGRAECIVETPKGKIESLIDEHLEQVSRALAKAV